MLGSDDGGLSTADKGRMTTPTALGTQIDTQSSARSVAKDHGIAGGASIDAGYQDETHGHDARAKKKECWSTEAECLRYRNCASYKPHSERERNATDPKGSAATGSKLINDLQLSKH